MIVPRNLIQRAYVRFPPMIAVELSVKLRPIADVSLRQIPMAFQTKYAEEIESLLQDRETRGVSVDLLRADAYVSLAHVLGDPP